MAKRLETQIVPNFGEVVSATKMPSSVLALFLVLTPRDASNLKIGIRAWLYILPRKLRPCFSASSSCLVYGLESRLRWGELKSDAARLTTFVTTCTTADERVSGEREDASVGYITT